LNIEKTDLISLITKIRKEIGHKDVEVNIQDIFFDEDSGNLLLITPDRPEKSVVIGKGGWVVGRLREELKINSIHVEAYSDFIVPQYRMKLALNKLKKFIPEYNLPEKRALVNLSYLLQARIDNPYDMEFLLDKLNLDKKLNNINRFKNEEEITLFNLGAVCYLLLSKPSLCRR